MDRITYEWRVTKMIDAAYKAKSFNEKTLIIKNIVNEDKVVLDTFMGTGSIGVACKELGCKYIGMELEHSYYEVAKKRIVNV